jgi:hypothetical protein
MPAPTPALIDWQPTELLGEERPTPPPEAKPVLVRTSEPGRAHHIALWFAGIWRMSGAQERVVYGVTDWALLDE